VIAETARLNGVRFLDGLEGPGSGETSVVADDDDGDDEEADAAAAMQVKLLDVDTAAVAGDGGRTMELFLPTVARTFDTASLSDPDDA
jgi:hypothetical protein